MSFKLDTPSRRIAFAVFISVLLHGFVLWWPNIRLPRFGSTLPTLTAKLVALPGASAKPKRKAKPAVPKTVAEPEPVTSPVEAPQPINETVAASAAVIAEAPAAESEPADTRPPLPQHAQLTFDIRLSMGNLNIGEMVHTLDIKDGRYVLKAIAQSSGIARAFKSYERNQYSNGTYSKYGLQPELFVEEIKDRITNQSKAVEFDHTEHLARFSHGGEVTLPPDTQDFLSVMYQFPPLANTEIATVFVSNGNKIERYRFVISNNETVDTPLGKLLTVHLRKMHERNEEGFEIWLAREYRLFPVKIRIIDKNGQDFIESIITDIRVSEEEGVKKDVAN